MEKDNRRYFICKYLKFRHILNLFINEKLIGGNIVVLYYFNSNWVSTLLEKHNVSSMIKKLCEFSLLPLNCDLSQMENEEGIPLIRASGCNDLYKVIKKLDSMELESDNSLLDCLNNRLTLVKEDLKLYIKQQVALGIEEDLLLVNVTHWLTANEKSKLYGKNLTVIVEKKDYWNFLVLDFAKSKNVNYLVFHGMDIKKNKGVLFTNHMMKLLVELARSAIMSRGISKPSEGTKIGISFYVLQNFTKYFDIKNYYLFWFYKSGIDPSKILIYVPWHELAIGGDEIDRIKKNKFNIVYCPTRIIGKNSSNVPVYLCTPKVILLLIQYLKQILIMRRSVKGKFMKEQWKLFSLLFYPVTVLGRFLSKEQCKSKV